MRDKYLVYLSYPLFKHNKMKTDIHKVIEGKAQIGLFDEDINTYHSTDAISSTNLREFINSPKKFEYNWLNGREKKDCEAFKIGSALHCKVLERHKFKDLYKISPDIDRRTKDGRETYARLMKENEENNVTMITEDQLSLVEGMALSIDHDPIALSLLQGTDRELSARVMLSNNLLIQCRPDAIKENHIIDIKTCTNISKFCYEIKAHGYHLQAAFYYFILSSLFPREYEESNFYFIAVEKTAPYEVKVFGIDNQTLRLIVSEQIKPALINLKNYLDGHIDSASQIIEWINIL